MRLAVLAGLVVTLPALAAPPLELDQMLQTHTASEVRLSPDGQYLGALVRSGAPGGTKNLLAINIGRATAQLLTAYDDLDVRWYAWADDTRLLFATQESSGHSAGGTYRGTFSIGRDGVGASRVDGVRPTHVLVFLDRIPTDPQHVLLTRENVETGESDVVRLNIERRTMRRVAGGASNVVRWIPDNNGIVRAALAQQDNGEVLLYRTSSRDEFLPTYQFDTGQLTPLAFHADNRMLVGSARDSRGNHSVVLLDPANGQQRTVLFEHPEGEVPGRRIRLARTARGIPVAYHYEQSSLAQAAYLEPRWLARQRAIDDALAGASNTIVDFSDDERVILVLSQNDEGGRDYYLFDPVGTELRFLFSL